MTLPKLVPMKRAMDENSVLISAKVQFVVLMNHTVSLKRHHTKFEACSLLRCRRWIVRLPEARPSVLLDRE